MRLELQAVAARHPAARATAPPALQALGLQVQAGEQLAVIGPSGAGKTSLLQLMACALRPSQARTLPHRRFIIEIIAHRHHHATTGNIQVQRLIQARAAMFVEHVLASYAHVGSAILHIGRHIGSTHDDKAHVGAVGGQDKLARRFRVFQRRDARRF